MTLNEATRSELGALLQELSTPFDTIHAVRSASIKLDALTGILLRAGELAAGAGSARALKSEGAELPRVLAELGGSTASAAATGADHLLELSRASIFDPRDDSVQIAQANAARMEFCRAFSEFLANPAGARI
jgi:hypothetical protein